MVLQFLRLVNLPSKDSSTFLLQTAGVRYRLRERASGRPFTLDLLSTVHLAEPAYYSGLQEACDEYDRVLFEIIADGELAPRSDDDGARRLSVALQATPEQRALAARHRLSAQMDALDAKRDNWVVADMPREELLEVQSRLNPSVSLAEPVSDALRVLAKGPASRGRGGAGSLLFRLVLCVLPAPEAALLLDDWIASGGAPLAPVLSALTRALVSLDLPTAQRLSFAQTLASGEATQWGGAAAELVRARNGRALEEVEAAVAGGCERLCLLYGALHMRDLRARLDQGPFEVVGVDDPEWRTAWTIPVRGGSGAGADAGADAGAAGAQGSIAPPVGTLLLATAGLLLVDGSDWVETVRTLIHIVLEGDGSIFTDAAELVAVVGLYLLRHGALYLALARWAFEWERRWFLFGAESLDGDEKLAD